MLPPHQRLVHQIRAHTVEDVENALKDVAPLYPEARISPVTRSNDGSCYLAFITVYTESSPYKPYKMEAPRP
jgi:hypothetical protein